MVKIIKYIMILDSWYNLSDDQREFQIKDRISLMRFLGLSLDDMVPDAKTIWLFRPQITPGRTEQKTFSVPKGQMVDSSMVAMPRLPNSREENKSIKNGLNISAIRIRLRLMLSTNRFAAMK